MNREVKEEMLHKNRINSHKCYNIIGQYDNFKLRNVFMKVNEKKIALEKFSERLRLVMNSQNISQSDLVRLMKPMIEPYGYKICRSMTSRWYNGKTMPKQFYITPLAKVLNVEVTWLLGYDDKTINYVIKPKSQEYFEILINDLNKLDTEDVYKVKEYIEFLNYKKKV